VRIVVSSLQGGSEKRALSSDSGTFVVANLDPGRYVVEASFPGFASWVAKVVVEPGQRLDRNVVLALDGFALNVEVSSAAPVSPRQAAPSRSPLRVGGDVLRPALTQMTEPLYPPNARDAGISGTVLLHGVINTSGKVNDLRVLGNPNRDLAQAAMDAVSEWTYRPSMLNGVPVAVPATISVDFRLR
jgi:protein TonB